ncbi:MAG: phosphatase PAP2 family protein [Bdellovibrionaceae bacterium]|nr:phosphatase PAP2 family protein [Pseudobdellovibrionaceae bacterium]
MLNFLQQIDLSLFYFVNHNLSNSFFDVVLPIITDLHKTWYFNIVAYPLMFFFLLKKFSKKGIVIFIFCILAIGTTDLVGNWGFKKTVQRARPGDNPSIQAIVRSPYGGYSFVSNHAANMFCFAFFMGFFFPKARVVLYSLAAVISFTRVYNGVHYPSDIIVGAMLGAIIAFIYFQILKRFIQKSEKEIT